MRSYEAARGLFSFLGFCSGTVIVVGVIVAIFGGMAASTGFRNPNDLQILLGVAPGVVISLGGFFGLAMVQMGRASVDSAEHGQQALEVSRQQLEVSRDLLVQGKTAAASYTELLKRRPATEETSSDKAADLSTGPSYSDRPEQVETVAQPNEHAQQIAEQNNGVSHPPELEPTVAAEPSEADQVAQLTKATAVPIMVEHEKQVLQDSTDDGIAYEDGKFIVEGKKFWSRAEATKYRDDLETERMSN